MRKLGPLRPLIAGRPTFKSYVFHQPGYYQPVQVFGINWGSCAVVRAAFHESGANVSVVRVVDGRHFRPTGLAPDEPCQEVEILNFLRHFLSVHWDLVQMKLYSLSAVCFSPVESGCPVRLNSIRQLSETWLSPGLPAGSPYSGFLTLLASLLELRKFSFYLECVVYGNPRACGGTWFWQFGLLRREGLSPRGRKFIKCIWVEPGKATFEYKIPMPPDNRMGSRTKREALLSNWVMPSARPTPEPRLAPLDLLVLEEIGDFRRVCQDCLGVVQDQGLFSHSGANVPLLRFLGIHHGLQLFHPLRVTLKR